MIDSVIVNRTMSYKIGESDFDVVTESAIFSGNATLNDVKKWYDKLNKNIIFMLVL